MSHYGLKFPLTYVCGHASRTRQEWVVEGVASGQPNTSVGKPPVCDKIETVNCISTQHDVETLPVLTRLILILLLEIRPGVNLGLL